MDLVGMDPARDVEQVCSGRVPVGPGAVRAAQCKPEKGLFQVLSGSAGGGAR